jgi:hypothetical protein
MTIDGKYNEMVRQAALALDTFKDIEPEALKSMRTLLPQENINFENCMRQLLSKIASDDQKIALSDLNEAYMEFISECRKEFSRDDMGKIVNLTLAFHGIVALFFNEKGEWKY